MMLILRNEMNWDANKSGGIKKSASGEFYNFIIL